jgi:hypothetical protein
MTQYLAIASDWVVQAVCLDVSWMLSMICQGWLVVVCRRCLIVHRGHRSIYMGRSLVDGPKRAIADAYLLKALHAVGPNSIRRVASCELDGRFCMNGQFVAAILVNIHGSDVVKVSDHDGL